MHSLCSWLHSIQILVFFFIYFKIFFKFVLNIGLYILWLISNYSYCFNFFLLFCDIFLWYFVSNCEFYCYCSITFLINPVHTKGFLFCYVSGCIANFSGSLSRVNIFYVNNKYKLQFNNNTYKQQITYSKFRLKKIHW